MGIFDAIMGSNPETAALGVAVTYGPMLVALVIAGIIFFIAFITLITESSHVPGLLLLLLSGMLGIESMYLMYRQHITSSKKK